MSLKLSLTPEVRESSRKPSEEKLSLSKATPNRTQTPNQVPQLKKFVAAVYSKAGSPPTYLKALGAIFAYNKSEAIRQATSLHPCTVSEFIDVSEVVDPFDTHSSGVAHGRNYKESGNNIPPLR